MHIIRDISKNLHPDIRPNTDDNKIKNKNNKQLF